MERRKLENKMEETKDFAVVYLVAGVSQRFGYKPKSLHLIGKGGRTLIEYSFDQALEAGFSKIYLVVGDKTKDLFKNRFGDSYNGIPISYALQSFNKNVREKPWGQVDALCVLKGKIESPFVVCNGDDLYGKDTFKRLYFHLSKSEKKEAATVYYRLENVLPEERIVNRGIFKVNEDYVKEIKEAYSISKENLYEKGLSLEDKCSMGIFALYPETIEQLEKLLNEFKEKNGRDREKEYPLGIGLSKLLSEGRLKMKLYETTAKWAGVTTLKDVPLVEAYLKENHY